MSYYVYVLRSESTGKTYIGQTDNLEKRVVQHNDPDNTLSLYTKRNKGSWRLIYHEICKTRSEAMKREKLLKTGVGREHIKKALAGC